MTSTVDAYLRSGMLQLGALPPLALYVHLPWCLRKCPYCDFNSHELTAPKLPSVATPRGGSTRTGQPGSGSAAPKLPSVVASQGGSTRTGQSGSGSVAPELPSAVVFQGGLNRTGLPGPGSADQRSPSVSVLGAELEQHYLNALRSDLDSALPLVWGRTVSTVFIGGGTPSLFSPEAIDRLLGDVRARLPLTAGCEVTLEANPGTFEHDRFRAFRAAGVTRLSIGVQSFDDAALHRIGRVHDGAQARAAVEEAAVAFDTFNLDLMYALPGQTGEALTNDLEQALAYAPPHLSVYHLTLEPNTAFARRPPVLPDDDTASNMLDRICALAGERGLHRYEVSAFARPGHHCRHNLNYWQFGDYLGIGAGAHSKLSFPHRVVRQVRWREPARYMAEALTGQAMSNEEEVGRQALAFEFMLNALRLRDGFEPKLFTERTGLPMSSIEQGLQAAQERGLIERTLDRIRPSARGFDFLSDLQQIFL